MMSRRRRGFTLIELMVSVGIVALLITISAIGFRRLADSNILAQAKSAVVTYAQMARSYAVANGVETTFVVNPFNGRFEIWYLLAPPDGSPFDPQSGGVPGADPPQTLDRYVYAPVLDSGARLPVNRQGEPLAAVHPIDFADPINPSNPGSGTWRSTVNDAQGRNLDNLTWSALCFDAAGRLVIRTRRIATRTFTLRNGDLRDPNAGPADDPITVNRLPDETPDLSIRDAGRAMVFGGPDGDSLITSTTGFIISDAPKMRRILAVNPTPAEIVNNWLLLTRPKQRYQGFAETVIFNRSTGLELGTLN